MLAAVAMGGAVGAVARWAAAIASPTPPAGFPWMTLAVNVLGCFLIGVLVALVTDVVAAHRMVRPFLGTGVLGGFTTFSGYAVDGTQLLQQGRVGAAGAYLATTLVGALPATWLGLGIVRHLAGPPR